MERLTNASWRNLDPWECCGQDHYCQRGCHDEGGCTNGCIVPKLYVRLAAYEDVGLKPEEIKELCTDDVADIAKLFRRMIADGSIDHLQELIRAEKDGKLAIVPPNAPLTLEELQRMDGEPVWIQSDIFPEDCGWRVVRKAGVLGVEFTDGRYFSLTNYDKSWLAYRRKPEALGGEAAPALSGPEARLREGSA